MAVAMLADDNRGELTGLPGSGCSCRCTSAVRPSGGPVGAPAAECGAPRRRGSLRTAGPSTPPASPRLQPCGAAVSPAPPSHRISAAAWPMT